MHQYRVVSRDEDHAIEGAERGQATHVLIDPVADRTEDDARRIWRARRQLHCETMGDHAMPRVSGSLSDEWSAPKSAGLAFPLCGYSSPVVELPPNDLRFCPFDGAPEPLALTRAGAVGARLTPWW